MNKYEKAAVRLWSEVGVGLREALLLSIDENFMDEIEYMIREDLPAIPWAYLEEELKDE